MILIISLIISFHTIIINFVIALLDVDGFNALLIYTDKFIKWVLLIPGRDTHNIK